MPSGLAQAKMIEIGTTADMKNPIPADALHEVPSGTLARFFSTRLLRELATSTRPFTTQLRQLSNHSALPSTATIADFYERALDAMIRKDRSEYVYKNAIAQKLLLGRHSINSAGLFFEFRVHQSKLDALLVNGSTHAFEIKTAQDELRRLPTQIADYQKTFTHVWVLTSPKHVSGIRAMVPREVGIAVLSKRYNITTIRRPQKRTKFLDLPTMISALRQSEFIEALWEVGIEIPRLPNTVLRSEALRLSRTVAPDKFQAAMMRQLKKRFAKRQSVIASALPRTLTAAGLGLSLTDRKVADLVRHLSTKLGDL
jgi:hypothetical protein